MPENLRKATSARRAALCVLALLVIGSTTGAQQIGNDSADSTAEPPARSAETTTLVPGITLEEVVVYGNRTLNSMRQEMFLAEEAFYDAFNAVNSNDEYDISCELQTRIGSRIKNRVCAARFVDDLQADYAKALLRGEPLPPINPLMMYKGRLLVEEMQAIAAREPAVLQTLIRLAEIKTAFEEERGRRCAGRIFCGR